MVGRASLFCLVSALFTFGGCSQERDEHDHSSLTTGKQLYDHHCAECHGKDGTGILTESTPASILTSKSKQGIVNYIKQESSHRDMPVFATMPDPEARKIAAHLLVLKRNYDALADNVKKPEALMVKP